MRSGTYVLVAVFLAVPAFAQPVTGLSGWDVVLDPGHSRTENQGVYGYSEAEKNLAVGLALQDLLVSETDVDTVYLTRWNSQMEVSLSQRVDFANSRATDHFHSIHSNAAGPDANFVLMLWPQYPDGSEAVPNGGKHMSEIMAPTLSAAMRIDNGGAIGECDFYRDSPCTVDVGAGKGGSRNFVQRYTSMASEISEAGFHTNPRQNQLNMNADWKRLEARALYWSILAYHGVERPQVGIVTGTVSDIETGRPINGATITAGDTSYVTDTYESLFHRYSNDPDQLRNGFYYLDGISPGNSVTVIVEAPGFEPATRQVTLLENDFTFEDVSMISTVPPLVAQTTPEEGTERFRIIDPVRITFSRPMNPSTVENAFSIEPSTSRSFAWTNGQTELVFRPDTLLPETDYTLRIADTAEGAYGHRFDGDGDGTAGGDFAFSFTTGLADAFAPRPVASYPAPNATDIERRPAITIIFNEVLGASSVTEDLFTFEPTSGGPAIDLTLRHHVMRDTSFIVFYPQDGLQADTYYRLTVAPGLADRSGNEIAGAVSIRFRTTNRSPETAMIDSFEPSGQGAWWQPQQSGSTTGFVTDSTSFDDTAEVAYSSLGSTQSKQLRYGWDADAAQHLIRTYLEGGPARSIRFDRTYKLKAYVFGDGSGNRFRFAVDDGLGGSNEGHEVSPWHTIDWFGWRPVEWDLSEGELGSWIGDGSLDPPFRFDSFQLTYSGSEYGTIYVDNLQIEQLVATGSEDDQELPDRLTLYPNYPNPFNPSTTLRFAVREATPVTLTIYDALGREAAVLIEGETMAPGSHEIRWDARGFSSGLYLARLTSPGASSTTRLILTK